MLMYCPHCGRLLSLRLYRTPYYNLMKPCERKLYDWGLLGYIARDVIGADQEERFGIRQNHSMYLSDWRRLISKHFVSQEYEIFVPERGWGERIVKNLAIRLDPLGLCSGPDLQDFPHSPEPQRPVLWEPLRRRQRDRRQRQRPQSASDGKKANIRKNVPRVVVTMVEDSDLRSPDSTDEVVQVAEGEDPKANAEEAVVRLLA